MGRFFGVFHALIRCQWCFTNLLELKSDLTVGDLLIGWADHETEPWGIPKQGLQSIFCIKRADNDHRDTSRAGVGFEVGDGFWKGPACWIQMC